MGAEQLVEVLVAALHGEVDVEVAQRGEERVRVADGEPAAVRVLDLELVLERQARLRQQRLPQTGGVLQLRLDAGRLDAHRLGVGPVRADDDAVLRLVGAENPMRIGSEIYGHNASAACCISRSMPATGIPTQSGRLSSSYRSSYTAFSSSNTASSRSIAASPAGISVASTVSR